MDLCLLRALVLASAAMLCGVATAAPPDAKWTGWQTVHGGTPDVGGGLDVSHTQPSGTGFFGEDMYFRIKNRYAETVSYSIEITVAGKQGVSKQTSISGTIRAGGIDSDGGNWAIGTQVLNYRVTSVRFPDRDARQRQERDEQERVAQEERERSAQAQRASQRGEVIAQQRQRELRERSLDAERQQQTLADRRRQSAADSAIARANALNGQGKSLSDAVGAAGSSVLKELERQNAAKEATRPELQNRKRDPDDDDDETSESIRISPYDPAPGPQRQSVGPSQPITAVALAKETTKVLTSKLMGQIRSGADVDIKAAARSGIADKLQEIVNIALREWIAALPDDPRFDAGVYYSTFLDPDTTMLTPAQAARHLSAYFEYLVGRPLDVFFASGG